MVAFKKPTRASGLREEKQGQVQLGDEIRQHLSGFQRESSFLRPLIGPCCQLQFPHISSTEAACRELNLI